MHSTNTNTGCSALNRLTGKVHTAEPENIKRWLYTTESWAMITRTNQSLFSIQQTTSNSGDQPEPLIRAEMWSVSQLWWKWLHLISQQEVTPSPRSHSPLWESLPQEASVDFIYFCWLCHSYSLFHCCQHSRQNSWIQMTVGTDRSVDSKAWL